MEAIKAFTNTKYFFSDKRIDKNNSSVPVPVSLLDQRDPSINISNEYCENVLCRMRDDETSAICCERCAFAKYWV